MYVRKPKVVKLTLVHKDFDKILRKQSFKENQF